MEDAIRMVMFGDLTHLEAIRATKFCVIRQALTKQLNLEKWKISTPSSKKYCYQECILQDEQYICIYKWTITWTSTIILGNNKQEEEKFWLEEAGWEYSGHQPWESYYRKCYQGNTGETKSNTEVEAQYKNEDNEEQRRWAVFQSNDGGGI